MGTPHLLPSRWLTPSTRAVRKPGRLKPSLRPARLDRAWSPSTGNTRNLGRLLVSTSKYVSRINSEALQSPYASAGG